MPIASYSDEDPRPIALETYDLIVMTQSCDIAKPNLQHLMFCPIWPIAPAAKLHPDFSTVDGKDKLRMGNYVAFQMLSKCEIAGFENDETIVQFNRIIEVPKQVIVDLAGQPHSRVRLLPPYREHLAQGFARFYMRVGLPTDIPKFAGR